MDNSDLFDTLDKLIETSRDGEYGFRTSAEHLKNDDLKRSFMRRSEECGQAALELQAIVRRRGGTPDDDGSIGGALHRGWVAVKATLSGYSDKSILEETERGEDLALSRYRSALEEALPDDVRMLVERQFEGVKRNHAQVRSLRDLAVTTDT